MTVGESPDAWRDHPRVCGEYQNVRFSDDWDGGSSPRMRGTQRWMIPPVRARGDHPRVCGEHCGEHSASFGAWDHPRVCGEHDPLVSPCRQCNRDHPRVCGEHDPLVPSVCDVLGSSPRMRGTLGRRVVGLCLVGIIPRMRGTPLQETHRPRPNGIIPAYAGNTDQSIILFVCVQLVVAGLVTMIFRV